MQELTTAARQAQLDDILITGEIIGRKPRRTNHAAEKNALVALAREMSDRPRHLFQKLVDLALELCHAGSAGISLLKSGPEGEHFSWEALAGVYAPHVGRTTPRDFSPCGVTLDRNAPQLFSDPGRYFTYFNAVQPAIVEGLVIPLYVQGRPIGTIWIVSHDERRRFDAEDVRIITSLGEFTSAAFHLVSSLDAVREREEALREADRRKDEFLATLAHELRNPLAPIRNSLHLLHYTGNDTPARDRALAIAERQTDHLIRLVDDLLEVSRITRGKLELRRTRVEVSEVVQRAIETSRPLVESSGHQLTVSFPARPLVLDVDPVRLSQVISNLLNNACRYTNAGGEIHLDVRREGEEAVIAVMDNGMGLTEEVLPRVFEMFTQGDESLQRRPGGLGIGLALVQSLVHLHGGTVKAYSKGPGQGSTFTVRLPLPREV